MWCAEPRAVWYADLGGIEAVRQDIQELIENPLRHPEVLDIIQPLMPPAAMWANGL